MAIVAPRFWPFVGDGPAHLLQLAQQLAAAGPQVTVVTPQWLRAWPAEMCLGAVRLVRLRGSGRGGWSTIRWTFGLKRWLRAEPLDAVLVAGLKHEAYAALSAVEGTGRKVIVLAEEDDCDWHRTAAFGQRIAARCHEATAIVAASCELAAQIKRAGFADDRVKIIPRRVPIPPPRSPSRCDDARASVVTANHDLLTTANTHVSLAVGRLEPSQRFGDLVRAWRIVTARQPQARLWIIGDGPERDALYRQIGDLDQRFRVMIPGTFDCLDDLLQAADLFLHPAACQAAPLAVLEAQAAGLSVVAASAPAWGRYVEPERTGLTYPLGDFKALAGAVDQLIKAPAQAVELGAAARAALQAAPTPADEAAEYLALIQK
jgi:glycosyltransferase involved in cell wall biosynthesis